MPAVNHASLLISIHASRGGSDFDDGFSDGSSADISIHASRGGSDPEEAAPLSLEIISIHASRGGSDPSVFGFFSPSFGFQSTLPAGEATRSSSSLGSSSALFQSTLPAGEATRFPGAITSSFQFQSTLPAGEATIWNRAYISTNKISIHASRGGSDCLRIRHVQGAGYFNPRFPRGKRPG